MSDNLSYRDRIHMMNLFGKSKKSDLPKLQEFADKVSSKMKSMELEFSPFDIHFPENNEKD
jgi:hypothetical protein